MFKRLTRRFMRWLGYQPIRWNTSAAYHCPVECGDHRAGDPHKLDPESLEAFDDDTCNDYGSIAVNVTCALCGLTGAMDISPDELIWD